MTTTPSEVTQADRNAALAIDGLEWLSCDGRFNPALLDILARHRIAALPRDEAKVVPSKPTRAWASAMANMRQGQSLTPRCEPPSEYDIQWAFDRIAEVLAAAPALSTPTSGEASAPPPLRVPDDLEDAVERVSDEMMNRVQIEETALPGGMVASQSFVRCSYNDLRIILAFVDEALSTTTSGEASAPPPLSEKAVAQIQELWAKRNGGMSQNDWAEVAPVLLGYCAALISPTPASGAGADVERATELLASIYEIEGDKLAAFTLRRGGPFGSLMERQHALIHAALASSPEQRLREEIAGLKVAVIAFAGPAAVTWATEQGLPEGHLHPKHYDLLARCGARMDGFTRAAVEANHG